MNKTTKIILGIIVAIILFFVVRQFVVKPTSATTLNTKTDTIINPQIEDIKDEITLAGSIYANQVAVLKFQNSGKLNWVGVKVGDHVKKWQVLATLDNAELKKSLQTQFNDYESQLTTFTDVNESYKDKIITDTVKRILTRTQNSLNNDVITYEIADMAIKESRLITPIEGIVIAIDQPLPGVNITPTTATITVVNPNSLYFRSEIDQSEVTKLAVDQKATINLDSFATEPIDTKLNYVAFTPVTGQSSTVYEIRFPLPIENKNLNYRLGMDGDVAILVKEVSGALTVPLEAINDDNGQSYVWTKNNDTSKMKKYVKTGIETDTKVEILDGINQNDQVVITKR